MYYCHVLFGIGTFKSLSKLVLIEIDIKNILNDYMIKNANNSIHLSPSSAEELRFMFAAK